ncbi:hypothetical protein MMA231_00388 [Asticcacaulis sp. MM231]
MSPFQAFYKNELLTGGLLAANVSDLAVFLAPNL